MAKEATQAILHETIVQVGLQAASGNVLNVNQLAQRGLEPIAMAVPKVMAMGRPPVTKSETVARLDANYWQSINARLDAEDAQSQPEEPVGMINGTPVAQVVPPEILFPNKPAGQSWGDFACSCGEAHMNWITDHCSPGLSPAERWEERWAERNARHEQETHAEWSQERLEEEIDRYKQEQSRLLQSGLFIHQKADQMTNSDVLQDAELSGNNESDRQTQHSRHPDPQQPAASPGRDAEWF